VIPDRGAVGSLPSPGLAGPVVPIGPSLLVAGIGRLGLVGLFAFALGCAHETKTTRPRVPRELILAHDDNRATANLTFPNLTYESIVRFELPAGQHRLSVLRLMAESKGTITITVYDNSAMESPGEPLHTITRALGAEDLSTGKDGRWVVEYLDDLAPVEGTVWIGIRKIEGAPSLWTSAVVSGQTYLRDRDISHAIGLLPVKRTPMLRLEVLP